MTIKPTARSFLATQQLFFECAQATYSDVIVEGRVVRRWQGNAFSWLSDAVDQVIDNGTTARQYGQVLGLQVYALHGLETITLSECHV